MRRKHRMDAFVSSFHPSRLEPRKKPSYFLLYWLVILSNRSWSFDTLCLFVMCLSYFQKQETGVTSTKHLKQNIPQIHGNFLHRSIRKNQKLLESLKIYTLEETEARAEVMYENYISSMCCLEVFNWRFRPGFLVEGEEKHEYLIEYEYWLCCRVCLLFIYSLTVLISWLASSLHLVLILQAYIEPVYPTLWATDFMRS